MAGNSLLDFLSTDDGATLGLSLLGAGAPTTDPGRASLGGSLSAALQQAIATKDARARAALQSRYINSQISENDSQAAYRKAQAEQAARELALQQQALNGLPPWLGGMGGAGGVPGAGAGGGAPGSIASMTPEQVYAAEVGSKLGKLPSVLPLYQLAQQAQLEERKAALADESTLIKIYNPATKREEQTTLGEARRMGLAPARPTLGGSGAPAGPAAMPPAAPAAGPVIAPRPMLGGSVGPTNAGERGMRAQIGDLSSVDPVAVAREALKDPNLSPADRKMAEMVAAGGDPADAPGTAPRMGRSTLAPTAGAVGMATGPSEDEKLAAEVARQKALAPGASAQAGATTAATATATDSVKQTGEKREKQKQYDEAIGAISDARDLLNQGPTGSYAGKVADFASEQTGFGSTKGAKLAAKLNVVAAKLTANVPRFEGPQSDKDVQAYKQAAGEVANDTINPARRLAALEQVEILQRRAAQVGGLDLRSDAAKPAATPAAPSLPPGWTVKVK